MIHITLSSLQRKLHVNNIKLLVEIICDTVLLGIATSIKVFPAYDWYQI
jgi:hypothetical protein